MMQIPQVVTCIGPMNSKVLDRNYDQMIKAT